MLVWNLECLNRWGASLKLDQRANISRARACCVLSGEAGRLGRRLDQCVEDRSFRFFLESKFLRICHLDFGFFLGNKTMPKASDPTPADLQGSSSFDAQIYEQENVHA